MRDQTSPKLRSVAASSAKLACIAGLLGLLCGCAATRPAGSDSTDQVATWTYGGMVSAANPYAAEAAAEVLRQGGHAVDAAIAAHAVLGLVEPQSSGLGGGAFMLVYEAASGTLHAYDGRETAPAGAGPDLFLVDGAPMNFLKAWQSGRAVGTPGVIALYEHAHRQHGRIGLAQALAPAIELATDGFEVSVRLAGFLTRMRNPSRLDDNPDTAAYFYPEGVPLAAGTRRDNPAYARTLSRFVAEGSRSFYTGTLAEDIVRAVRAEPDPGSLSLDDLAAYRVAEREPVCGQAGAERICTMPPPSSGLTQIMILNLYDAFSGSGDSQGLPGPVDLAALVDAQRLAYADRDHYVADADSVPVPVAELIDPRYLAVRAGQRFDAAAVPVPGDPGAVVNGVPMIDRWGRDTTEEVPGTTHLSIIDGAGNAVSMTATVEAPFGSSRWAGGFLLNNQMTDFARAPTLAGKAVANQAAPGRRPRSSMSPVIVFDERGELKLVAGSPGGNSIIAYVAKVLVRVLRAEEELQAAVDAPNIIARGATVRVETGVAGGAEQARALNALGYPVQERQGENSGLHVILVTEEGLTGAADPRREGAVIAVP